MKVLVFPLTLMLLACSGIESQDVGFYTWVDASGNIHTERRDMEIQEQEPLEPLLVEEEPKLSGENEKRKVIGLSETKVESKLEAQGDFNSDEYVSSDLIDEQLAPKRLYSWQDQGAQITQEISSLEVSENEEKGQVEIEQPGSTSNYEHLAQERVLYFNEIKGRELKLETVYIFSDQLNSDYILIEIYDDLPANKALFKSYIKKNKIALPNVVFLSDRYEVISLPVQPFSHHVEETWSAHGFMQGVVEVPSQAAYMLILSSTSSGVLELGGKNVKAVNLGSVLIDAY